MSNEQSKAIKQAADQVLELAAELEASGDAKLDSDSVATARAALHQWVDTITAVISTPAFGRVTVIHQNGQKSSINSAELAFALSR